MYTLMVNLFQKEGIFIKPVSQKELKALFDNKIIKNTCNGFISLIDSGRPVGHYRTLGGAKRVYIEDKYALKAKELVEKQ